MEAKQRIEALAIHAGVSVKQLAERCGYERPQAFYDVQRGRTRNISAAMGDRILQTMPEINRVWLMTGEGQMLSTVPGPERINMVPLVPLSAFAGPIKAYHEDGVDLSHCEVVPGPPHADLALPISGDSMEPLFANGSIAFVKRINEEAFIPWGHPLVLDTENGVYIKNVLPDEADQQYVWGESVNPRYPKMHIPKKSIYGLYRVLSVSRAFATM